MHPLWKIRRWKREGTIHLILIAAEFVVVAVFLGIMLAGVNGTAGLDSAKLLVTGVYKIVVWGYFIVLRLLFPLVVFILQYLNERLARKKSQPVTTPYHCIF